MLTGEGPDAFCSGGDQRVRGDTGYESAAGRRSGASTSPTCTCRSAALPKPVVAMVAGYAIGGGHVLHVVCDLTIAAENARFGQTGPRVGSFDGGYGASILAAQIGQKRAKEIWFLCRQYDARRRSSGGSSTPSCRSSALERETVAWCREMLALSPFALRLLKASFNAAEDGLAGLQQLAHDANLLFYGSEEAREGRTAYVEKRAARLLALPAPPVRIWLMAARPRTLPAAVAPVLVGTSLAIRYGHLPPARVRRRAARRDADPDRHEPLQRLLRRAPRRRHRGPHRPGARDRRRPGAAAPVLVATYLTFGAAVLCGVYLIAVAGWLLLAVGAASILAGVLYTGGPRPYGYEGLGEVFVFLFFGVVAVTGSYFVQRQALPWEAFVLSVPVGLLIAAILVVNNVRDIDTDRRAGKRTLAVRLGRERTRVLFAAMVVARVRAPRGCRGSPARCRRGCS